MPKVSVIIPVYGVEKYIERCARSLFEQTLDDIEYLFIDDCTPDGSISVLMNVLEDFPQRKHQVIIHRMERNSGQAKVREWGMKNASGEYVIHCDSDDWVDTNMYRAMYDKAKEDDADIVVCDYYRINHNSNVYKRGCLEVAKDSFFRNCITMRTSCATWNKLVRACLFNTGDFIYPYNNMGEDMVIMIQIIMRARKLSYVSAPYYFYFENEQSITNCADVNKVEDRNRQYMENVRLIIDKIKESNLDTNYSDEILFIKWIARRNIWILTDQLKYFNYWKSIWPEIDKCIWHNRYISRFEKMKYVMTYFRLYPSLPKLYRKILKK